MIELNRISEAKKQIRLQAWTDMYREFLASGKAIKAWCEENGERQQQKCCCSSPYIPEADKPYPPNNPTPNQLHRLH